MAQKPQTASHILQKFSWRTFALGLGAIAAAFVLHYVFPSAFERAELVASDFQTYARPARARTGKVVIVAIDDRSIAQIGQWPWSRGVLARLEDALREYKAAAVGYDIIFSESDSGDREREAVAARLKSIGMRDDQIASMVGANADQSFADAIQAQGKTVLGYAFGSHGRGALSGPLVAGYRTDEISPRPMEYSIVHQAAGAMPELLHADSYLPPVGVLNRAVKGTGFVDIEGDADGEIRTELTAIRFHNRYRIPFFMSVLSAYEGSPPARLDLGPDGVEGVSMGDIVLPVDAICSMMVSYRGPAESFPHLSAIDVINHAVAPGQLAGKIVLIGVEGKGLGDRAVTPGGPEFPRVEIHANAIDAVLAGDFIRRSTTGTKAVERLAAIILGVGIALAGASLASLWALAGAIVMGGAYLAFAQYILISDGVLIGIVLPVVVAGLSYFVVATYRYLTEGLEKRYLRHAFEHYLHPNVIASVVDNPGGLKLGGDRRVLTILFADIVNYTGLSERTDPAALVALLNDYMTTMTDRILESGGVVDKIRGDGIMAFWGAPVEVENHARAAIEAGLAMLTELKSLRQRDARFADIDIGVGIATGEAIVGNFGGARRFDYSVIGDTVNLASRLEGLTRNFKVHLLVNKTAFDQAAGGYLSRDIGRVRVKGKTQAVPVVEVVAHANDGVDSAFYRQFERAIDFLNRGDAGAAREQLEVLRQQHPGDEVVGLYLEKLHDAGGGPPAEVVFEFDHK
ncbi:MAG TPA: adenylate/guanylate cyclase domain-containing protein [Candidatus Binataceae bacterium]|nr:adenylate/guanylate cyclase domain-containing protein [Candidatus Binataceae bacterium]